MVTSCSVIGCSLRHSKDIKIGFFRFPTCEQRCQRWIVSLKRKNVDGSPWSPGYGDRVCGKHFHSGRPHCDPAHPDWTPSLALGYGSVDDQPDVRNSAMESPDVRRFERSQQRDSIKLALAATAKAAEKNELAVAAERDRQRRLAVETVSLDHTYCRVKPHEGSEEKEEPKAENEMALVNLDDIPVVAEVEITTECSRRSCEEVKKKVTVLERALLDMKVDNDLLTKSSGSTDQARLFGVHLIVGNDAATRFYTGLPVYGIFAALLRYLEPKAARLTEWRGSKETAPDGSNLSRGRRPWAKIPIEEQLLTVLVRLRLCLNGQDLSQRTGIPECTLSRLFSTWVIFLARELPLLFPWPSRELIDSWMPQSFKKKYPSTRIVIDCMEAQVQRPHSLLSQSQTYSQYKSRNTFKILVGISPAGLVTFLSEMWGGRVSDRQITAESELITKGLLERGDSVMADRGFDVEDLLAPKGVKLNIPPFLQGQQQLSQRDVEKTRRIAEVRIHVERAIGRARRYEILNSPIPVSMASMTNEIMHVCFLLTNFDKPLVAD